MSVHVEEWEFRPAAGLAALSRDHPAVTLFVRPLGFRWAVRAEGPSAELEILERVARGESGWIDLPGGSALDAFFAYVPRTREISLLRTISQDGGFVLSPLVVRGGGMRVRYIGSGHRASKPRTSSPDVGTLCGRWPLTALALREELMRQAPDRPSVTRRQWHVLRTAVRKGYYEVPRRTTVARIAEELGLGRSTVEEHLRSAESEVVRAAVPSDALGEDAHFGASTAAANEHYAQFSSDLDLFIDLALFGDRVARVELLRTLPSGRRPRSHPYLDRVLHHVHGDGDDLRDIPVELRVPPFQRAVLEELRRIPSGATRTYADIAKRIGHPGAARAVGNACAHNPVPVVVPCHRVVPTAGGVGSYSAAGGEATKLRLLRNEGAVAEGEGAHGVRVRTRRSAS
jgi:O-6-methylguanine DNA methyltransferase